MHSPKIQCTHPFQHCSTSGFSILFFISSGAIANKFIGRFEMFYYHYEALLDFRQTSDIMCKIFEIVRYKTQFYFATAATSTAVVARIISFCRHKLNKLQEITVLWRIGKFFWNFLTCLCQQENKLETG